MRKRSIMTTFAGAFALTLVLLTGLAAANYGDMGVTVDRQTTAPQAVASAPASGASGVAVGSFITISFSLDMNRSSVESAFSIEPNVTGLFSWSGNSIVSFTPSSDLDPATTYTITVDDTANDLDSIDLDGDADGVAGGDFTFFFTTAGGDGSGDTGGDDDDGTGGDDSDSGDDGDTEGDGEGSGGDSETTTTTIPEGVAPYVVTVLPENGQDNVSVKTEIRVTFNVSMDKDSVQEGFRITPGAHGSHRWQGTSLIFHPAHSLISNTDYLIVITSLAKSSDGEFLTSDYSWRFITEEGYGDSDSGESGIGCFVATAAFGSKSDPTVGSLIKFRDEWLLESSWGSAAVSLYYRFSPPVADYIAGAPVLQTATRVALLPAMAIAWSADHLALMFGLLLLFSLPLYRIIRSRRYET